MSEQNYSLILENPSQFKFSNNSVSFEINQELGKLTFLKEDLIKIQISQGHNLLEPPSNSCVEQSWPGAKFSHRETKNKLVLKTAKLEIVLTKKPFKMF